MIRQMEKVETATVQPFYSPLRVKIVRLKEVINAFLDTILKQLVTTGQLFCNYKDQMPIFGGRNGCI